MHFHKQPEKKVKVAKVDGDTERALQSRFGVQAYPSFYLIDGYSVYKYEGYRDKDKIIKFAEEGYRKQSPVPFLSSPMGPIGLSQGALLSSAYAAFNLIGWLQETAGISSFFAVMLLFGTAFIGLFILIVLAAVAFTPKDKID